MSSPRPEAKSAGTEAKPAVREAKLAGIAAQPSIGRSTADMYRTFAKAHLGDAATKQEIAKAAVVACRVTLLDSPMSQIHNLDLTVADIKAGLITLKGKNTPAAKETSESVTKQHTSLEEAISRDNKTREEIEEKYSGLVHFWRDVKKIVDRPEEVNNLLAQLRSQAVQLESKAGLALADQYPIRVKLEALHGQVNPEKKPRDEGPRANLGHQGPS